MGRKPLTTKQFIQARKDLYKSLTRTMKQIDVINENFIREHCTVKVGGIVDVPENIQEGYTQFRIGKISPDIQIPEEGKIHVSFALTGEFVSDGKEPLKGILKFKNQDNGKGKEEATS